MTEQPTPPAPSSAELEAARRIGEALCLIPPQSTAQQVTNLIASHRQMAENFSALNRLHTDTLNLLEDEIRPFIGEIRKRFAEIDKTLIALRHDVNIAHDQLKPVPEITNQLEDLEGRLCGFKNDIAFALDEVKPMADICATIIQLRRQVNKCLDQNGFRFPHPEPIAPESITPEPQP